MGCCTLDFLHTGVAMKKGLFLGGYLFGLRGNGIMYNGGVSLKPEKLNFG